MELHRFFRYAIEKMCKEKKSLNHFYNYSLHVITRFNLCSFWLHKFRDLDAIILNVFPMKMQSHPQVYQQTLPHTLRCAQQKPTFHDRKTYVSVKENIGFPFEKHKKDKRK